MENEIRHYNLKSDLIDDEYGPAVILTQDNPDEDEPHTIALNPWQLRAVCEQFGIKLASDSQAAKTIAALQRRILVLHKRIAHLADFLETCSDRAHANLDYEVDYVGATLDIANEFCADFSGNTDEAPVQPLTTEATKLAATGSPEAASKDLFN